MSWRRLRRAERNNPPPEREATSGTTTMEDGHTMRHDYERQAAGIRAALPGSSESELAALRARSAELLDQLRSDAPRAQPPGDDFPGAGEKAALVWDFLCDFSIPVPDDAPEELHAVVRQACRGPLTQPMEDSLGTRLQQFQDSVRRDFERVDQLQAKVDDTRRRRDVLRAYLALLDELCPPLEP